MSKKIHGKVLFKAPLLSIRLKEVSKETRGEREKESTRGAVEINTPDHDFKIK